MYFCYFFSHVIIQNFKKSANTAPTATPKIQKSVDYTEYEYYIRCFKTYLVPRKLFLMYGACIFVIFFLMSLYKISRKVQIRLRPQPRKYKNQLITLNMSIILGVSKLISSPESCFRCMVHVFLLFFFSCHYTEFQEKCKY